MPQAFEVTATMADDEHLTTWTLGGIKSMGMVIEGACSTPGCGEFARFDLDALIETFGSEWRVPKVLPVRCTVHDSYMDFQVATLHD